MRVQLRRLRDRVSRRGYALLFFGLLSFSYTLSLARPEPTTTRSPFVALVDQIMPLRLWAALWFITGVVCVVFAFLRRDKVAFAMVMGLITAWGLISLVGWVAGDIPRGWVGAGIWLSFASWIHIIAGWPDESRDELPPEGVEP